MTETSEATRPIRCSPTIFLREATEEIVATFIYKEPLVDNTPFALSLIVVA